MSWSNISTSTCSFAADYWENWAIHFVEIVAWVVNLLSLSANAFLLYLLATVASFHVHLRVALAEVALAQSAYFAAKATQHSFNMANFLKAYLSVEEKDEQTVCAALGEFWFRSSTHIP